MADDPRRPARRRGNAGCPLAEARPVGDFAFRQDFERGRIYDGGPRGLGVSYVPNVFADALDKLRGDRTSSGEEATGIPVADPDDDRATDTRYFQRFQRPISFTPDSTLQIRGPVPALYVSRRGGDLDELRAPFNGGTAQIDASPSTATLTEHFSCSGDLGPWTCTVAPSARTTSRLGVSIGTGNQLCGGNTYPTQGTPEWQAILGDAVNTRYEGWVKTSHFARFSGDNPLTHHNIDTFCLSPFPANLIGACPSDWNLHTRPLRPFENRFADVDNGGDFEIEWEKAWGQGWFDTFGEPQQGDLVFANGRWIIDCGHDSFPAEIHSPSLVVLMRTDSVDGHESTRAQIWANEFFGDEPIVVEIPAPPRISPRAALIIEKPTDQKPVPLDAAGSLLSVPVTNSFEFLGDRVRVEFTAPPVSISVDEEGEQFYPTDPKDGYFFGLGGGTRPPLPAAGMPFRAYMGVWQLFWQDR